MVFVPPHTTSSQICVRATSPRRANISSKYLLLLVKIYNLSCGSFLVCGNKNNREILDMVRLRGQTGECHLFVFGGRKGGSSGVKDCSEKLWPTHVALPEATYNTRREMKINNIVCMHDFPPVAKEPKQSFT
jgi:hypothetical protein